MDKYKLELGSMVTIMENIEIEVFADNKEDAVEAAINKFHEYLEYKYSWYDMDDVNVEYIEKI